ncbi:hypothetical protein [Chitinophaga sp.]|uniref:hypothetical protein n=1 Tax=Chitinophaga sp. TaxID=1869181 RepID=UPI0026196316|nr:hypothetical protein [uncultured Chitinophaga sp.]
MTARLLQAAFVLALPLLAACGAKAPENKTSWRQQLADQLPALGHRNWIVVADQAFPELQSPGITYINSGERLLPVLKEVLAMVKEPGHVTPILYRDKELGFITETQSEGIGAFRDSVKALLAGSSVQEMLHDSVFAKLDAVANLFRVVVVKTDEKLPYTSVLMELDCAYWNGEKEAALRQKMTE